MIAPPAAGFVLILICGIYWVNMINSRCTEGFSARDGTAALSKVINQPDLATTAACQLPAWSSSKPVGQIEPVGHLTIRNPNPCNPQTAGGSARGNRKTTRLHLPTSGVSGNSPCRWQASREIQPKTLVPVSKWPQQQKQQLRGGGVRTGNMAMCRFLGRRMQRKDAMGCDDTGGERRSNMRN